MQQKVRQKFKKKVAAKSTEYLDFVPPAGVRWLIQEAQGSAAHDGDTRVEVLWDRASGDNATTLFMSYGTTRTEIREEIIGDGTKQLSIVLVNDSSRAITLFGQVLYVILG
jgi:hypothetical protein